MKLLWSIVRVLLVAAMLFGAAWLLPLLFGVCRPPALDLWRCVSW